MSATVTVTGNLGHTPEIRQAGRSNVLELNIAATHAQKDKQSGQWADEGDPLWIKAPFWNDKADYIADMGLVKGARVTVEGTLIRRSYTARDGENRESLELLFPRFLGVVPRRQTNTQGQAPQPAGGFNNTVSGYDSAPAGGQADDPWGTQQDMTNAAPF